MPRMELLGHLVTLLSLLRNFCNVSKVVESCFLVNLFLALKMPFILNFSVLALGDVGSSI